MAALWMSELPSDSSVFKPTPSCAPMVTYASQITSPLRWNYTDFDVSVDSGLDHSETACRRCARALSPYDHIVMIGCTSRQKVDSGFAVQPVGMLWDSEGMPIFALAPVLVGHGTTESLSCNCCPITVNSRSVSTIDNNSYHPQSGISTAVAHIVKGDGF